MVERILRNAPLPPVSPAFSDSWMFVKEKKSEKSRKDIFWYFCVGAGNCIARIPQTSKMESFAAIVNPGYCSVMVCTNFWVTTQKCFRMFFLRHNNNWWFVKGKVCFVYISAVTISRTDTAFCLISVSYLKLMKIITAEAFSLHLVLSSNCSKDFNSLL